MVGGGVMGELRVRCVFPDFERTSSVMLTRENMRTEEIMAQATEGESVLMNNGSTNM